MKMLRIWETGMLVMSSTMLRSSSLFMFTYLTLSQAPMDQWLRLRARYLHLLLEMEGLTKAPKCTICGNAMEMKCTDCTGGNYFCKACCIQSHRQTPFHWLAWWTGKHFAPVSLYSLGFALFLGHHGEPCPLTVEV